MPQVVEIVDLVDATMAICLIMSAPTFGLVNTLIATVAQRTRELGMLRALGMNQRLLIHGDGTRRYYGGGHRGLLLGVAMGLVLVMVLFVGL